MDYYGAGLDTLLVTPFEQYSRGEFFLLTLLLLVLAAIFMMIWRRR